MRLTAADPKFCYKCKRNEATHFLRVNACTDCLRFKIRSSILKVWLRHMKDKSGIRCGLVCDESRYFVEIEQALQSLRPECRPNVVKFLSTSGMDIGDDSVSSETYNMASELDTLNALLPSRSRRLEEAIKLRLLAKLCQDLSIDTLLLPWNQEDLATQLMVCVLQGQFARASEMSSGSFYFRSKTVSDSPQMALAVLAKISRAELKSLKEQSVTDSSPETKLDMHGVVEQFLRNNSQEFPSMASNVCSTLNKMSSSLEPSEKKEERVCQLCCIAFVDTSRPICVDCQPCSNVANLIDAIL
eukprot:Gregarina_sp_Poly_1__2700@NODE_1742_length_3426_cov_74_118190_g1141_i0_p2_GENE_NODE_1742_length_3426_cov_74_118190_g1141_i0NODE_1742_length_3426_cov_74_118190_g1141_i0_p2_ORF_typecomplete_len301_score28_94CTU2/PF10288_9/2_8e03CTU2/PF10288_9/2_2e06Roplike/PF05082_13/2_1e02Roplike/PF05082_13/1_87TM_GPCR_Srj/PF10319_9/7_2e027TM_GPCR_Srj/PF10319_9/1_1_NODE_1742_length_3426_cov_74_118190_g1141_i023473249